MPHPCRPFPEFDPGAVGRFAEADDHAVWEHAKRQGFTIVSHDADFAEMAALLGPPPKVIWLRGGNRPTSAVARALRIHADTLAAFAEDPDAACLELY